MTDQTIIKTSDLAFGCQHTAIIKGMSIEIKKGEFIGIFGQNGSGKSTFLKTLLGQIKPHQGGITLFGHAPKKGHNQIGYMPQTRASSGISHLTCKELLRATINGTKYGLPILSKLNNDKIEKTLSLVEAANLKSRCINQLSGGELKRIYLAQALLNQPELLLLDEPLANLDPRMQDHFISVLNTIRKKLNITILMTAHNPNALLTVMDRALYFGNQRALIGKTDDVITTESLTKLYGTPIEVLKIRNRLLVLGECSGKETEEIHHHDS